MKKFLIMFCVVYSLIFVNAQNDVSANMPTTFAEKVWSVEMNTEVLDELTNLNEIQVRSKGTNEVIPAIIEVNETNGNVIEVYPKTNYLNGEYELIVGKGFKAKNGLALNEDVSYLFQVDKKFGNSSFNGLWETTYKYEKSLYLFEMNALNGLADIKATNLDNGFGFEGTKNYSIKDGYMNMNIDELNLNLSGEIRYYSDAKVKLVTKSGNFTYFTKVQ